MGKKFTTLISILALGASGLAATISPPPAFAAGEISLDNYWSFSEILELKNAIETAAKSSCGEDYGCMVEHRKQEISSHYQEDRRYSIVSRIINTNFIVTGIDPTKETITIYCNNENLGKWESTREESYTYLKDIYLAWAEEGYPDMRTSSVSFTEGGKKRSGPIYVANANNGNTIDKVHLVFAHKPSDGNPADTWLEYGKEITLNVAGSNLINDTKHMLHYAAYTYEDSNTVGAVTYGRFAANYQSGMEYKIMYDKNNLYDYWVPQYVEDEGSTEEPSEPTEEPTKPTEDSTTPDEPTKTAFTISVNEISTSSIGVPTTPVATTATKQTNSNSTSNTKTTTEVGITPEKTDDNTIELPLSGGFANQNPTEEEHVFPWWIVAFIFSGITLTIWWFIPTKKYKKTIDK